MATDGKLVVTWPAELTEGTLTCGGQQVTISQDAASAEFVLKDEKTTDFLASIKLDQNDQTPTPFGLNIYYNSHDINPLMYAEVKCKINRGALSSMHGAVDEFWVRRNDNTVTITDQENSIRKGCTPGIRTVSLYRGTPDAKNMISIVQMTVFWVSEKNQNTVRLIIGKSRFINNPAIK